MPILIEVSDDAPLNQGDILTGISLFQTGSDWTKEGGQSRRIKSSVCMVLSRPCAILHKPQIVVASVQCVKGETPKDVKTFEKVKQFLEQLRDGFDSPDRFYLGQAIPSVADTGRFFARLDSLHTVRLPDSDALGRLLVSCRVATLAEDFRRDLHRRILSAFAAMGFDDYGWYSNQDLDWLIATGRKELSDLELRIKEKEAEMAKNVSSGQEEKNEGIARQAEKLSNDAAEIRRELDKYEQEHAKRHAPCD
jgi:hypothetical protein